MGFFCHAEQKNVEKLRKVLVPIEYRNVTYIGKANKPAYGFDDSEPLITEGWEIVKEISVCEKCAEAYTEASTPVEVGQKQVIYTKPPKKKVPFKKFDDTDDDKKDIE